MRRFFIPALISIAFLATLTFQSFAAHFIDGQSDFRSFYAAGYILRTGNSSRLYDYDFQHEIQEKTVGGDLILPFLHPPHEAALFVPFSFLSYRAAYTLFALLNVGLLVLSYRLLGPTIHASVHEWLPLAMFATFLPVAATLLEGQDSIIFLTLLSLATLYLDRNDLLAGVLVGLCSFRFQLALPIVFLFFLWKRWRFVAGFSIAGLLSFLASLAIVGWNGIRQYLSTLMAISIQLDSHRQMVRLGVYPVGMANIRGLSYGLFRNLPSTSLLVVTAALSVAVIVVAAKSAHHTIAVAITAAILVSYHSMNHDLVLLLIPISVALNSANRAVKFCGLLALMAPFVFILALPYQFLTSIPILALLVAASGPWALAPTGVNASSTETEKIPT